jgi:hypothetical protein
VSRRAAVGVMFIVVMVFTDTVPDDYHGGRVGVSLPPRHVSSGRDPSIGERTGQSTDRERVQHYGAWYRYNYFE